MKFNSLDPNDIKYRYNDFRCDKSSSFVCSRPCLISTNNPTLSPVITSESLTTQLKIEGIIILGVGGFFILVVLALVLQLGKSYRRASTILAKLDILDEADKEFIDEPSISF